MSTRRKRTRHQLRDLGGERRHGRHVRRVVATRPPQHREPRAESKNFLVVQVSDGAVLGIYEKISEARRHVASLIVGKPWTPRSYQTFWHADAA